MWREWEEEGVGRMWEERGGGRRESDAANYTWHMQHTYKFGVIKTLCVHTLKQESSWLHELGVLC